MTLAAPVASPSCSAKTATVSDYDTWGGVYPGLGLPGSDDDGDGLTNDEERIFGLNPQNGGSANPYAMPFDPRDGHLQLHPAHPVDSPD